MQHEILDRATRAKIDNEWTRTTAPRLYQLSYTADVLYTAHPLG
jgi:hypothetical protein